MAQRIKKLPKNFLNLIKNIFVKKIKFTISIVFAIIFLVLALPQFNLNFENFSINFPNIDLSLIDSGSVLGNFRRGKGLFPTHEIKGRINFGEEEIADEDRRNVLTQYVDRITRRINLTGLYDIEVTGEIENDEYFLVLGFPDYYKNRLGLVDLLTKKGEIKFADGMTLSPLTFKDSDVNTNIDVAYNPLVQSHLRFGFPADRFPEVTSALQNESGYFYMTIDESPFVQIFQLDQNDVLNNIVRGLPLSQESVSDLGLRDQLLNIIRVYFSETEPLPYPVEVDPNETLVPSEFVNLSTRYIAILSVGIFIALTIFSFIKLKFKKGIAFALMTITYLGFTITFLKYLAASLSINTVLTYLVMSGITTLLIWNYLMLESRKELEVFSRKLSIISIVLILVSICLVRFIYGLGDLYDVFGVTLVFGVSLLLFSWINFKAITKELVIN